MPTYQIDLPFAASSVNQSSLASVSAFTVAAASTAPWTGPSLEPAEEPSIVFTTAAELFAALEATDGDALMVHKVPAEAMRELDRVRDLRQRKVKFFYFSEKSLLIVTIPTGSHETMYNYLQHWLSYEIGRMGLISSWMSVGGTRYPGNSTTGSSGEGDSGGLPLPARGDSEDWPTLVFESGYSQSLISLRMKMRFWFAQSDHDVKIVILAKAFPDSREKRILIEQWQARGTPPRPGATTTRRSQILEPVCLQTINVVWALETPYDEASVELQASAESFNVTRGPLVLDFAMCFLREPNEPNEHDFVFSDKVLQTCAARVWKLSN